MPPDRVTLCQTSAANRSVGPTDRTDRSIGQLESSNHHTQTHPSHQRKKQST
ncbi:hypothetical protein HanPSC8_Chr12g0522031 [Helianthus annuus]|nr:hypothetical protein HanPSC8_Chr12g0522031 [Helianthus annuus]